MVVRLPRLMGFVAFLGAATAQAITPTFTWSVGPADSAFEFPANWVSEGGTAPTSGGALIFGPSSQTEVKLATNADVNSVAFTGVFPAYSLTTSSNSQLRIGAGGLTVGSLGASLVTVQSTLQIGLTASQSWHIESGKLLSVAGNFFEAGAGSQLTKTGTGTLVLSGNNSFTGGLKISNGTVSVNSEYNLGFTPATATPGNITIDGGTLATTGSFTTQPNRGMEIGAGGGAIVVGTSTQLTIQGIVAGTGPVVKGGAGTLILAGSNTYTGPTSLSGGVTKISADSALGGAPTTPTPGHLTISGATLWATDSFTLNSNRGIGLAGSASFNVDSGKTLTYDGIVAGSGDLLLNGGGILVLGGGNTYSGATFINGGTLRVGHATGLGSTIAGTSVASGGALEIDNVSVGAEAVTLSGNGMSNGGALVGTGTAALAGNITLAANTSIGSNSTFTLSGAIGDNASGRSLTTVGAGTVILTGTASHGGGTTVNGGTLQIGNGGTTGTLNGAVTIANGVLAFNRSDAVTFSSNLGGGGSLHQLGSGTLTLLGNNNFNGGTTIANGALSVGNGGTTGSISGNVSNDGTLIFNRSDITSFGGQISGDGSLIKRGSGTLTLNNTSNSFSGAVLIEAGTLTVSGLGGIESWSSLGTGSIGTGTIAIGSGATTATLRYNGGSNTWTDRPIDLAGTTGGAILDASGSGSVDFAGQITATGAGTKTLTLTGNNNSSVSSISGSIGDNSPENPTRLLKTGFGTWRLASSTNAYTGGTVVTSGELLVDATGALPAGEDVTISHTGNNRAILDLNSTAQTIGALNFAGGSGNAFGFNGLLLGGSGSLTLGGNVTVITTNSPRESFIGRENVFDGSYPFGGTLNLGGVTRIFDIGDSAATDRELTVFANISNGAISKIGSGLLVLAGDNGSYAGGTMVSGGTLLVGASGSSVEGIRGPLGSGTLTLAAGSTFGVATIFTPEGPYDGDITIPNAISLANNVTLGSPHGQDDRSLRLSGAVQAAGAVTALHLAAGGGMEISGSFNGAAPGTNVTFDAVSGDSPGFVFFTGTVGTNSIENNLVSVTASGTALIFASPSSLATTTAVKVTNQGYAGVGVTSLGSVPLPSALLARIAPADRTTFAGTFGFDTQLDRLSAPYVFSENLDFSGFGSGLTLGSTSAAVLTGELTPSSNGYAFGNGGGGLFVRSNLSDVGGSKSVSVNSNGAVNDNALSVIFQGNNTYSGNLSVTNSVAVLDSANALPAGSTVTLGVNGYLGATEAFTAAPGFPGLLSRLTGYTSSSVLGFDSTAYLYEVRQGEPFSPSYRYVDGMLDLTNLGRIYLGTATNAVLAGRILAPNQSGAARTLSLLAVGDGSLTVLSPLLQGDVNRVEVGPVGTVLGHGRVELLGANTYPGGTTLLNGELALANRSVKKADGSLASSAIGTGLLTVAATAREAVLKSAEEYGQLVLHNAISLGARLQLGEFDFEDLGEVAGLSSSLFGDGYYYNPGLVVLNGTISGSGGLDIQTNVTLTGANTFSGGVKLNNGLLTIGSNTALGTGPLMISPFSYDGESSVSLSTGGGPRTLSNPITINAYSESYLGIYGKGSLTLNGPVALNGNLTFGAWNSPLIVNGAVSGSGQLNVYGANTVVLAGTNTFNGSTNVYQGSLIFSTPQSLQNQNGLSAGYYGYIGVGFVPASLQNDFFSKFNKDYTSGALGFDGPLTGTPTTITTPINLGDPDGIGPAGSFGSNVRLGSATRAVIASTATITPQGSEFLFGGGGGLLEVNSILGDDGETSRYLTVRSENSAPLTLRLGGANTYTATTRVDSSALIFRAGAMPASAVLQIFGGGYIGTEDTGLTAAQNLIDNLSNDAHNGTIGFDSYSGFYNVTGTLDLSGLNSSAHVLLGTATQANINASSITLPDGQTTYRFAGFKGGQLTVNTVLGGANSVAIGDPSTPATFRSPIDASGPLSSVTLMGNNGYTGGTILYAGQLLLGHDNALGSGGLQVAGNYYGEYTNFSDFGSPVLGAASSGLTITNNIALGTDLTLGGSYSFALNGVISGSGELYKTGNTTVTLGGNNTFYGGIYIAEGTINIAHANALGTGALRMGGPLGPTAIFDVDATIHGIAGDNSLDTISVASGRTLTVQQSFDSEYFGRFGGSGALKLQGYGELRLVGDSSGFAGPTSLDGGVMVRAANNNAFGPATNVVTLHNGTLAVESGVTISNALVLTDGALAGTGTFKPASTLTIGGDYEHQMALAPGFSPGTLTFDGSLLGVSNTLNLAAGGAYHWEFQDAANTETGWDKIVVNGAVNISATAIAPFDFKIISLGADGTSGLTLNFNPTQAGQWLVLSAYSITGFTGSNQFAINLNEFSNATLDGRGFNFSISGATGNMGLMLNFDPTVVPEPSTYALLVLGLGLVAWTIRRRRA